MLPFLLIALFVTIGCLPLMLTYNGRIKVAKLRMKVVLKQFTRKKKGILVKHVNFPLPINGKQSDFNHVLVTQVGIFIITLMDKNGKVSGSKDEQEWSQFVKKGNAYNKFANPLLLDDKRIKTVSNILGIDKNINSLIVFVNGNIKKVNAPVLTIRKLYKALKAKSKTKQKLFSHEEIVKYADALNKYKDEQLNKFVKENNCPKCQKTLKLIKNKNTYIVSCTGKTCKFKIKLK